MMHECEMELKPGELPGRGYVYGIVMGPPLPAKMLEERIKAGVPIMMVDEERVWSYGYYVPKEPIEKARKARAEREAREAEAKAKAEVMEVEAEVSGVGGENSVEAVDEVTLSVRGLSVEASGGGGLGGGVNAAVESSRDVRGATCVRSLGSEGVGQQVDMLVACAAPVVTDGASGVRPLEFVRDPLASEFFGEVEELKADGVVTVLGHDKDAIQSGLLNPEFDVLLHGYRSAGSGEGCSALGEMHELLRAAVDNGVALGSRCASHTSPCLRPEKRFTDVGLSGLASVLRAPVGVFDATVVKGSVDVLGACTGRKRDSVVSVLSESVVGSSVGDEAGSSECSSSTFAVSAGEVCAEDGGGKVSLSEAVSTSIRVSRAVAQVNRCEVCGKTYARRGAYERHVRKAHAKVAAVEQENKCSVCGEEFLKRYAYNRHMKKHNKDLSCTVAGCNKMFSYQRDLDRHVRTHAGGAAVAVCACGHAFARADNVKRHVLENPGHVVKATEEATNADERMIKNAQVNDWAGLKCSNCGKVFGRSYKYREHVLKCDW